MNKDGLACADANIAPTAGPEQVLLPVLYANYTETHSESDCLTSNFLGLLAAGFQW